MWLVVDSLQLLGFGVQLAGILGLGLVLRGWLRSVPAMQEATLIASVGNRVRAYGLLAVSGESVDEKIAALYGAMRRQDDENRVWTEQLVDERAAVHAHELAMELRAEATKRRRRRSGTSAW
jgi:hypothetical protein